MDTLTIAANCYVIKTARNMFIALDQNSGGYPYEVSSPFNARHWPSVVPANHYLNMDPELAESEGWEVLEFVSINARKVTK